MGFGLTMALFWGVLLPLFGPACPRGVDWSLEPSLTLGDWPVLQKQPDPPQVPANATRLGDAMAKPSPDSSQGSQTLR